MCFEPRVNRYLIPEDGACWVNTRESRPLNPCTLINTLSVLHIYIGTSLSERQTCVVRTVKRENSCVHMLNMLNLGCFSSLKTRQEAHVCQRAQQCDVVFRRCCPTDDLATPSQILDCLSPLFNTTFQLCGLIKQSGFRDHQVIPESDCKHMSPRNTQTQNQNDCHSCCLASGRFEGVGI